PRLAIGSAGTTATRASTHLRAAPFELGEGASGRSKRHHASARSPERSRSSAGRTRHGVTGASLRRRPAHFRNGRGGAAGVAGRITLAPVGDSRSAAAGADDGRRSSEAATLPAPPLAPARTNKARAAG